MNVGCMIENQIRLDTTLIFGFEAMLKGYHSQIMFSLFLMSDRFKLLNKLNMASKMFLLHLPLQ